MRHVRSQTVGMPLFLVAASWAIARLAILPPSPAAASLRDGIQRSFNPVQRGQEGSMEAEKVVLDREDMRRTLIRVSHEIVERNAEPDLLAIVGIHRRGAVLAARVHRLVSELLGA